MKSYEEFLYLILGYTKQTIDNFVEQIEKLIEKGTLTDKEGRDIIDEFVKNANQKSKIFEEKMEQYVKDLMEKFHFASQLDINKVSERIKLTEQKIDELNKK